MLRFWTTLFALGCALPCATSAAPRETLSWEPEAQVCKPAKGAANVTTTFVVTNRSAQPVSITAITTSCSCTSASLPPLPAKPYVLAPGGRVVLEVTIDLRGQSGELLKIVRVETSAGTKSLDIHVVIPGSAPASPREPVPLPEAGE